MRSWGVDRKASAADIKSAYRRLAKKLHPDANKNDPKAATRFAELNAAHEILGDEDKRKAFDRGEIDAEGKPRFQGFGGGGQALAPASAATAISKVSASVRKVSPGPTRRGRGARRWRRRLWRASRIFCAKPSAAAAAVPAPISSRRISASAPTFKPKCRFRCRMRPTASTQRLHLPNGKDVDVKIPVGITNGQHIRLKGQGMPGQGGAGDVLITVTIAPHPLFTLDGADLRLELPVTLYEAALGAKVRVPTLDGRSSSRSRRGPRAAAPSASRARAFRPKTAAAIFSRPSASCCPKSAMPSSTS